MTIAELFVRLGFKIEGKDDFDKTVKGLEEATVQSVKAAAGIDLIAGALVGMVTTAVNAGVALQKFALDTGLSRTELQQWEHTAALGNVTAQELQASVKGIQMTGTEIAFGHGDTQPWALLGINPHSNPFVILRQLNTELQSLDVSRVAAARMIAQQAGISDNMFQLLRQRNLPIDSLKAMYLLTQSNQQALLRLNIGWQNLLDSAERVKNRFGAEVAPAFATVVRWIQQGVDYLTQFVNWLDSGSTAATAFKWIIGFLAVVLVAAATAMSALTVGLGLFTSALIAANIPGVVLLGTILAIGVAAIGTTAALLKLWDIDKDVQRATRVNYGDLRAELVDPEVRRRAREALNGGVGDFGHGASLRGGSFAATSPVHIGGITVNLPGGFTGDPLDTARAIGSELRKQLEQATWDETCNCPLTMASGPSTNIIPSDAPSIFDSLSTLQQQALVMPTNPPPGIAGFIFAITGDEIVELESRITDHFIEDNTSIQDNIAIPPEEVTVKGIVGELVFSPPPASTSSAAVPDALPINATMVPAFTPVQVESQANAAAAADLANENLTAASSPYSYYGDQSINPQGGATQTPLTNQASAFGFFYQLWLGRMLFTIQTAFGIWVNMAIKRVRMVQSEDSIYRSDVQITFKKIRIAGAAVVNSGQLAGRNALQSAPTTNNGIAGQNTPTDAESQALFSTFQGTTQPSIP